MMNETIVTLDGFDSCYTPATGGRIICKVRDEKTHPDFRLMDGEILIQTIGGGVEAKHPNCLRHLTVGDVRKYYSRSSKSVADNAIAACVVAR